MVTNITENILQIIAKHKSAQLQVIYKDFNKGVLKLQKGILKNMNASTIQLTADNEPGGLMNIKFFEGGTKKIFAIYNKNMSELLSLKTVKPLNTKLRNVELQKMIIKKIKPYLQQEIAIVISKMENFAVLNGLFSDMGITEVSIKPAPFFNTTERVNYASILNIYNKEGHDLIEV